MSETDDEAPIRRALAGSAIVLVVAGVSAAAALFLTSRPEVVPAIAKRVPTGPVPAAVDVPIPAIAFTDITISSGIDFLHESGARGGRYLPETMGGGVAFLDFNGDGDQDLFFVNGRAWPWDAAPAERTTSALYRGNGDGTFTNVTKATGLDLDLYGMGVATGDYDGDGDIDIFVTAVGRNRLFENVDGEHFIDVTARAGLVDGSDDWSTGAAFIDVDNDGDLDLFVCNYVTWSRDIDERVDYRLTGIGRAYGPPTDFGGTNSILYRNDGGTFTDVSAEAGVTVEHETSGEPIGKALAVLPLDVDGDGWLDLAVANDTVRNFLFHNQGDGTFEEVAKQAGFAFDSAGLATGAMGIDAFRAGTTHQIAIGNFAGEMTSFYRSDNGRTFTDDAIVAGIGPASRRALTFGVLFTDVDLDGEPDLFQVNGHVEPEINRVQSSQRYRQPIQLFWQCGAACPRAFEPVSDFLPDIGLAGRGAAYADIDHDGDEDIVVTQVGGRPVLLRNDTASGHHFITIEALGKSPNTGAIGATVHLEAGDHRREKMVMPTRSYLSQVALPVNFGLGEWNDAVSVRIRWPDGSRDSWPELAPNQHHRLRQGTGTQTP